MAVSFIKEIQMPDGDVLKYSVEIPPISDADAEQQKLIVSVDGVNQDPQILAKTATEAFFEIPQGSQVQLFLSYLDDADPPNEGPSTSTDVFVAKDKVAPGAPGPFGAITCVSEIAAEPVEVTDAGPDTPVEPVVEEGAQGPIAEPAPEEPASEEPPAA